jgi:hypothetical protein
MPLDAATLHRARQWMDAHQWRHWAPHYRAEACAMALDLAGPDGSETPEALYVLAMEFFPEWDNPNDEEAT